MELLYEKIGLIVKELGLYGDITYLRKPVIRDDKVIFIFGRASGEDVLEIDIAKLETLHDYKLNHFIVQIFSEKGLYGKYMV